jgi:hypothetical protein
VPSEGTYLSELRPPRTKDGPPIVVRVIEDSVITDNDDGEQVSELFFLATTLLDPQGGPGRRPRRPLPQPLANRDQYQ